MIEINDLLENLPSHREVKFNDYWDAVSRVLDRDMTIPDERRTGRGGLPTNHLFKSYPLLG